MTALNGLIAPAAAALAVTKGQGRGPVATEVCNAAFAALITKMRFIKERFFLVPPLTNAELIALGLKPKDSIITKKAAPKGAFTGRILSALNGAMQYVIEPVEAIPPDPPGLIANYDVYLGLMPPGGATLEQAAGPKHYLMHTPTTYADLNLNSSVSKKRGRLSFDGESRGMAGYISFRATNGKENQGPPGPVVGFVVP